MGYPSAIQSTDNMKAVTRLPNYLRNKFYKEFKSNDIDESKVDLLGFSQWLDERLSEAHNPIALIINAEEKQEKELEKSSSKHKDSNQIHLLREDNKDVKIDQENFKIICWLCTGNHKISNCEKLKKGSIENRRSLVKQKKLCFNCLSNTHMINTCKFKRHCQVDNCQKRHHTLLHSEEMPVPNSPDQIDNNINNIFEREILSHTYLQIVPVTLTNSRRDRSSYQCALRYRLGYHIDLRRYCRQVKVKRNKRDNEYIKCCYKYEKDTITSSKLYNNVTD